MPEAATVTVEKEASSQDVNPSGDPFDSVRLPGNGDSSNTSTETKQPEGKVQEHAEGEIVDAEVTDGEVADKTVADATKTEAEAPKLWAGSYKTPEELEIAYKHSSGEGKRLSVALKTQVVEHEKTVAQLRDQIEELKIAAEAGPEIAELTEEQLEAMGPVKAMRFLQKMSDRKSALANLKARREAREQQSKKDEASLVSHIKQTASGMEKDAANYPDYLDLQGNMEAIMDAEPGITGLPNTPYLLYFAAYGQRALKRDSEAKSRTEKSKEAAKLKAKAAAVGAGAAGAAGGAKGLVESHGNVDPDSDEAYNERLVKAGNKRSGSLF